MIRIETAKWYDDEKEYRCDICGWDNKEKGFQYYADGTMGNVYCQECIDYMKKVEV